MSITKFMAFICSLGAEVGAVNLLWMKNYDILIIYKFLIALVNG